MTREIRNAVMLWLCSMSVLIGLNFALLLPACRCKPTMTEEEALVYADREGDGLYHASDKLGTYKAPTSQPAAPDSMMVMGSQLPPAARAIAQATEWGCGDVYLCWQAWKDRKLREMVAYRRALDAAGLTLSLHFECPQVSQDHLDICYTVKPAGVYFDALSCWTKWPFGVYSGPVLDQTLANAEFMEVAICYCSGRGWKALIEASNDTDCAGYLGAVGTVDMGVVSNGAIPPVQSRDIWASAPQSYVRLKFYRLPTWINAEVDTFGWCKPSELPAAERAAYVAYCRRLRDSLTADGTRRVRCVYQWNPGVGQ